MILILKSNSLNVFQARRLRIEGLPNDTELNPYVKAFLVPGKSFKYRTKTIPKSKVNILFTILEIETTSDEYVTPYSLRISIFILLLIFFFYFSESSVFRKVYNKRHCAKRY